MRGEGRVEERGRARRKKNTAEEDESKHKVAAKNNDGQTRADVRCSGAGGGCTSVRLCVRVLMRGQDTREEEEKWEAAALLHDYRKKEHIICIGEWNPNMLEILTLAEQK